NARGGACTDTAPCAAADDTVVAVSFACEVDVALVAVTELRVIVCELDPPAAGVACRAAPGRGVAAGGFVAVPAFCAAYTGICDSSAANRFAFVAACASSASALCDCWAMPSMASVTACCAARCAFSAAPDAMFIRLFTMLMSPFTVSMNSWTAQLTPSVTTVAAQSQKLSQQSAKAGEAAPSDRMVASAATINFFRCMRSL